MPCALAERNELGLFQPGNQLALANEGGRPYEYSDEDIANECNALDEWIKEPKNYYFTSFLISRDLHPQHIERFSQRSSVFRDKVFKAKMVMEQRLVDLGVTRKGDGNFIKFILTNKAGWKEKQEISGDSANPLALVLEQIAKQNQDPIEIQALEAEQLTNQLPNVMDNVGSQQVTQ